MKDDFVGSGLKYFHVFAWSAASLADLQDTADISFPLFVTPPSFGDETVHQLLSNEKEFKRQKLIPGECLVSVRRGTEVDKPKIGMTIQSFTPKVSGERKESEHSLIISFFVLLHQY
jgi:hypothetical protein